MKEKKKGREKETMKKYIGNFFSLGREAHRSANGVSILLKKFRFFSTYVPLTRVHLELLIYAKMYRFLDVILIGLL